MGVGEEGEGIEGWGEEEAGGGDGGDEDVPQQEVEWEDGEGRGSGVVHGLWWLCGVGEVGEGDMGEGCGSRGLSLEGAGGEASWVWSVLADFGAGCCQLQLHHGWGLAGHCI